MRISEYNYYINFNMNKNFEILNTLNNIKINSVLEELHVRT